MSVSNRLVYDPTATESSQSVGAYILAGTDGEQIDSTSNALWVEVKALTASDVDIRDLTAASDSVDAWLSDGAGNAISSTTGYLDVQVQNTSITVSDSALANTAIENTAKAVSTSAIDVVTSALANRKYLYIANEGNKIIYFGKNGVTTSNGFPCWPGEKQEYRIGASVAPQVIGATGASSEDLRVMELS